MAKKKVGKITTLGWVAIVGGGVVLYSILSALAIANTQPESFPTPPPNSPFTQ